MCAQALWSSEPVSPIHQMPNFSPYIKPSEFLTLNKSISLSVLQNFSKIPHDNHSFPFLKPKFYHVKFSLFSQFIIYRYLQIHLVLNFFTQTLPIYLILKKKIAFFFLMTEKLFKVRALWTDPCQVNPRCTTPFARTVHQIILELNSS